jgi:hypothetical protein
MPAVSYCLLACWDQTWSLLNTTPVNYSVLETRQPNHGNILNSRYVAYISFIYSLFNGSQSRKTLKYCHESRGTRNQEWLYRRGPAEIYPTDIVRSSDYIASSHVNQIQTYLSQWAMFNMILVLQETYTQVKITNYGAAFCMDSEKITALVSHTVLRSSWT